jgi:hypothetical protein
MTTAEEETHDEQHRRRTHDDSRGEDMTTAEEDT